MNNKKLGKTKSRFKSILSYIMVGIVSVGLTVAFGGNGKKEKVQEVKKADDTAAVASDNANGNEGKDITFIDNWYMDTRVKFIMDGIWHRMGNMGEILDTVKNIRHTSELSWFREWNKTAERVMAIGDNSLAGGHDISAGDAYLRAANYYLAAEVFLHVNSEDPRILETYKKGADCFIKGMKLLGEPVTEVSIPYEGTTLRGYFFKTALKEKAPTLLVHQGFDAPIENTKYIAEEAIKRGYNCLLFDGPGQGLAIREQKLAFRPDWEKVVGPVVDYVETRPDVDKDNIMLMGISMGGGFAVRAAAYEPRLKLTIVDPGYINCYDIIKDMLTPKLVNLYEQDPVEFDKKFLELTKYDVGLRWGIYHGMWVFGCKTPSEFFTKLKEFNYEKDVDKIKCKMLVMDGTGETWGKGQAKKLYDELKSPKYYMQFTEEDAADGHCQVGGPAISTQRMFDWLDENLGK
ncbi:MAG: alpha/beta hydrolase [Bacillota bacterium]|nr:alpha/beta hydrolase [Bacillota bacterium]